MSNEIIGGGNACFLITGYCSRREASGLTHMRTRTRLPRLKRRHVHEREGLIDDEVRKREGRAGDERETKRHPQHFLEKTKKQKTKETSGISHGPSTAMKDVLSYNFGILFFTAKIFPPTCVYFPQSLL